MMSEAGNDKQKKNGQQMTYREYSKTKEGELYEVLDGYVLTMGSPSRDQHHISMQLSIEFGSYLRGKKFEVFAAPTDVFLFEDIKEWDDDKVKNWVIPDLSIVCDPDKLDKKGVVGAPNLIIEITSPSTAKVDYLQKRSSYQKAGVKEYWIIDPSYQKVDVYVLEDGVYNRSEVYFREDSIKVSILDNLSIKLENIFPEREE